jgi:hypothetical protein
MVFDLSQLKDLLGARSADSENVGKCDIDAFVAREIDTFDACHGFLLALTLFVFGILTDHSHDASPLDDAALLAHAFDRSLDFHSPLLACLGRFIGGFWLG